MDPDPSIDLEHVVIVVLVGLAILLAWIPISHWLGRRLERRLRRLDELVALDRQDRLLRQARERSRWVEQVPENDKHVAAALKRPDRSE